MRKTTDDAIFNCRYCELRNKPYLSLRGVSDEAISKIKVREIAAVACSNLAMTSWTGFYRFAKARLPVMTKKKYFVIRSLNMKKVKS